MKKHRFLLLSVLLPPVIVFRILGHRGDTDGPQRSAPTDPAIIPFCQLGQVMEDCFLEGTAPTEEGFPHLA